MIIVICSLGTLNRQFIITGLQEYGLRAQGPEGADMQLGEKLRHLRMLNGLTQEELAQRCNLSKGFISQVENDLTSPSIATLDDILECLGSDMKRFFSDTTNDKIVFREEDRFDKVQAEEGASITWLIPNAQGNQMEPILLLLDSGKNTQMDKPHTGEEFGYVLSGSVYVHYAGGVYRASKGDSFYFPSKEPHYLENRGKTQARVLWVASPPSF